MKIPSFRALVLTAGFGLRLRPLTLFLPKALLPICGEPVAGNTLKELGSAGCETAALNLHHLGHEISELFGERYRNLPLVYSVEPEILGTLGALYPLRDFLGETDFFVLVNGDTLCSWPFKALIRTHIRTGADVTMLLHRRPPEEILGGPVAVGPKGAVVQLRNAPSTGEIAKRHLFAGAHVLSRHLLERIEPGKTDIVGDLYIPLLAEGGKIQSVLTSRRWHDLGTPERYLAASLDAAQQRTLSGLGSRPVIAPSASVASSAALHRSIVEAQAVVEAGAVVEDSLLLPSARILAASSIRGSIIGPGVNLPDAANIEKRLVTRRQSGYHPSPQDSVMGELVYTPLTRERT